MSISFNFNAGTKIIVDAFTGARQGADGKFFSMQNRRGEVVELKADLRNPNREVKRDAVKKVIASMTMGKDVSVLFPDVINCVQTDNLELKKLVYLYLINYAKVNPELALLAVNTFVKDANDPNPLIRALAIRTMGCIHVEKISEYLCEPLTKCLKDDDPYVRKTAAICVAKLHTLTPELVEDRGYIDTLRNGLLGDSNPSVVANAVVALCEISSATGKDMLQMSTAKLQKLLAALNECTEWNQIFILDTLCSYVAANTQEVEGIIDRITPRLQHSNSAVVMSALKVILHFMDEVTDEEKERMYTKKLAPPLVSLLNTEPEVQYAALRNINLIILKRPKILENEIKVFFCKYNDPVYVKLEKLEIMTRLASEKNVEQVLLELKEYATEVDVDFVRSSVRAIGKCAIKLERAAEKCVHVLIDLITTKVNYVVQEAIVVIKDIFRKYPNRYESIISILCENLDSLDEPDAKATMVWIIGEYAQLIDNADELLESFLESFQEETSQVQLQLLTATVKLFLKNPDSAQETVQRVLHMATEECENPDLRDRGYIYWRLLSTDPDAARTVVLSEKPPMADDSMTVEPALLEELLSHLGSLASIYHKPPEAFVVRTFAEEEEEEEEDGEYNTGAYSGGETDYYDADNGGGGGGEGGESDLLDMLGDTAPAPAAQPVMQQAVQQAAQQQPTASMTATSVVFDAVSSKPSTKPCLVTADVGKGLSISGIMKKKNDQIVFEMDISNATDVPVSTVALQFNKNAFGIAPSSSTVNLMTPIANGSSCTAVVGLAVNPQFVNAADTSLSLQVAMKNMATGAVFYFAIPIALDTLLTTNDLFMDVAALAAAWKGMDESLEVSQVVNGVGSIDAADMKAALTCMVFVTQRDIPGQAGQHAMYFLCRTVTNISFIVEIKCKVGLSVAKVSVRSSNRVLSDAVKSFTVKQISA